MTNVSNLSYGSMIVWAAKGNPGCATFLAELYKLDRGCLDRVLRVMSRYPDLRGSNGYMIWNDACERDHMAAFRVFNDIATGCLPLSIVHKHLAEGRCAPFRPEEYRKEAWLV